VFGLERDSGTGTKGDLLVVVIVFSIPIISFWC